MLAPAASHLAGAASKRGISKRAPSPCQQEACPTVALCPSRSITTQRLARVSPTPHSHEASLLLAGLVTMSDDELGELELSELDAVSPRRSFSPPLEDNAAASGTSMGSMDAYLLNSCQSVVPGCGSHTVVPAQPWQQVMIQGCYVLHGPAVLHKVAPGLMKASLRPGGWLECLNTGMDAASSIRKEAEKLPQQPSGLLLSDDSIRITSSSLDFETSISDSCDSHNSNNHSFSPAASRTNSSHHTNGTAHGVSNGNGHGGHHGSPPPDPTINPVCDTAYVLSGAHMELHGSFSLYNTNGSTNSTGSTSGNSNGNTSSNGWRTTTDNGDNRHIGNALHSAVPVGPIITGHVGSVNMSTIPNNHDGGLSSSNSMTPDPPGHEASDGLGGNSGTRLPGLLPHDGYVLVSVHTLPEDDGLVIELHDDGVISHPLNVVAPKQFAPRATVRAV